MDVDIVNFYYELIETSAEHLRMMVMMKIDYRLLIIDNHEFPVFDGANYCGGVVVHER